jgi:hypothetical protein
LEYAITLLQIASDAKASRERLTMLTTAENKVRTALALHDAAKRGAEAAAKKLADLQQEKHGIVQRANELDKRALEQSVASAAHAERHKALDARTAELAKREAEHAAAVKAHNDRLAQIRAQLG